MAFEIHDMIDTKPYLNEIRLELLDVLKAYPSKESDDALCKLDLHESLFDAFPEIAKLGAKRLKYDSYAWARNARYKRKPTIVDEMRLAMYDVSTRMFKDEKALNAGGAVDGKASAVVRSAAQIAAVVASKAMFEWLKLDEWQRGLWKRLIESRGKLES